MSRKNDANLALPAKTRNFSKWKPSTPEMVITAVKVLNMKGGTSLFAIKKFIEANYDVRMEHSAPLIRKFLRNALSSGILVRTRGQGLAGSFQLSTLLSHHVGKPHKKLRNTKKARRSYKKEKGKPISAGGVVVRNEPVKEEILKQELNLMDDESDEEEVSLEENVLAKDGNFVAEDEEVAVKIELKPEKLKQ